MGKYSKIETPATAPVKCKCGMCAAERVVSADVWNSTAPRCYWCDGKMIFQECQLPLVTLLGYSENGVFHPAPSNPWTQRIVRLNVVRVPKGKKNKKRKRRYRQDAGSILRERMKKSAKPVRESVVKRPEVKLRPIRDHSHNQAWRNSSKGD